ncbi:MAG TPA: endonuclease III [Fibrobacteria bacterium]|jgi:endonuclease-3|nr:endonuclease III [Fibrobacteria bacterium]
MNRKTAKKAPKKPAKKADALRKKAQCIGEVLDRLYPDPPIPLDHTDAFSLCVAVLLSAQATDVSVNKVTPELFRQAPDPASMVRLGPEGILKIIRTIGLAPTKSRNVWNLSRLLLERHGGKVPHTMEELEALPGVGHKTASVVMAQAFGVPAFPVDTHIHRLAARWGLSSGKDVGKTEADLKALFPEEEWGRRHLQIIYYGRERCPALRHDAAACEICREFGSDK